MRLRTLLFGALLAACGPDKGAREACPVGPDFDVLVRAEYGPLPADTVLRLHYGGRPFDDPEVLVLADPGTPHVLFCYVSDRDGVRLEPQVPLGGRESGGGGAGGESQAAPEPDAPIEALDCELWTAGSADLDVVSEMYGTVSVGLQTKKNVCVVHSTVELTLGDAGMK